MLTEVKESLSKEIGKSCKLEKEKIFQTFSVPKEEFGDLSTNVAFVLAKEQGKNPMEIAQQLKGAIEKNEYVERIETKGPYLNIFLNGKFYSEALKEILKKKEKFGKGKNTKKKMLLEFFHANTHKGVHIGHIRNISLGESLSRVLEFAGNKVTRVNYQGDIGPHVAKCLWGFLNLYNGKAPKEKRGIWLGKVYSEASNKIKDNEELEKQAQEINLKIYAGDKKLSKILRETRQWCLDDFEEFYKEFDVKFDHLYFESQTEKLGKKFVLELLKKGVVKKDDGAIILDFKEEGLGVFILLTREGYPLYSTKDLGLAKLKFDKYKVDQSIHVVGKEQELYFKQLFKTFERIGKAGYKQFEKAAKISHHLIYELVMLPEGKMSSREGTMVLYEDLKQKLLEKVREEIQKRHSDWDESIVEKTAMRITLSAMKFSMVRREPHKQMIFDWDQALSLEGDSGPYIQYVYVRVNGILEKSESKSGASEIEFNTDEKRLIKRLCEFPEIVKKSADSRITHNLADYLLVVAADFNKFYASSPVLKEEGKLRETRLGIVQASGTVIKSGLRLLGIECPEKM